MQFPKSKRFTENTSEVPGPGAYDVPIAPPDAPYKKGGMLEKDRRFVEHDAGPDTFGLYDPDVKENKRPRASSGLLGLPNPERARQQLEDLRHRLQSQHEKDLAKLQTKVMRLESAKDEATRDKGELTKELAALKVEIRTLTSRETSLVSKLTKAESSLSKHTALIPQLQSKLESLSTSHTDSRKRKDAEIASLTTASQTKDEEIEELREEVAKWKSRALEEREGRKEVSKVAEEMVKGLRKKVEVVRVEELLVARYRIAKLERQLGDRVGQVVALGEYSEMVGEEADELKEELNRAEEDRELVRGLWREEREDRRNEKEWRQRARSDQREMNGLKDEVMFLEEMRSVEKSVEESGKWCGKEKVKRVEMDLKMVERELEVAEGELDLAINEEIPRLEEAFSEAKDEADEVRERASELHEALAVAEDGVKELQARAEEEMERHEGELEEERRKTVEKEKEVEKERGEKKRVGNLLAMSRAAEAGLREELDFALAELAEIQGVRNQHKDLVRTLDQLARQNAMTEEDNRQLVDQNTDLISHGNNDQKIRHLAHIRQELAESRRKYLSTTSSLTSAEQENAALRAELDAYRSVSASSTSLAPPSRSRVSRPAPLSASTVVAPIQPPPPSFVIHEEDEPLSFVATTTTMASSLGVSAARKAGRVAFADEEEDDDETEVFDAPKRPKLGGRPSGGLRMQGKMTIDELF